MTQFIEKADHLKAGPNETQLVIETALGAETLVEVAENAHLTHYRISENAHNALTVKLAKGASYDLITVHMGSGKLSIAADLADEEAVCRSDVVYALNGDERVEIYSDFQHNADKTVSRQLVKGAVNGASKAVFEGAILIPYNKKAIDGAQQHRALLLSENTEVKAVPKLEIYADDVKCAHGSAIGTLNKEQMFYLETRGIDRGEARKILTTAFLNEVMDAIAHEKIREEWEKKVADWIEK